MPFALCEAGLDSDIQEFAIFFCDKNLLLKIAEAIP